MACSYASLQPNCNIQKPIIPPDITTTLSSTFKPFFTKFQKLPILRVDHVSNAIKSSSLKLLDAFVDAVFEFVDQPLLPSQTNFGPVDELKASVVVTDIEGMIPRSFREGVYVRNGPNPLFGGLKSTTSLFGRSSHIWVEGEGMVHALYFSTDISGNWTVVYNNKHLQTKTFKLEKQRNKPSFLPAIEGDSPAILSAYLLNWLRFGKVNKDMSNTNIFEHSGKFYAIAENNLPQQIDILTLQTLGVWDVEGSWKRPFTSHPKRDPRTKELVVMGVDAVKPFVEIGVISADGKELLHRVDLKLERSTLCHEIGITEKYNVFLDYPLSLDMNRLVLGGPLIKYNKYEHARIGVMPRYGDEDSIKWFEVASNCTFHIINCFENDKEVVVMGCRALESIIPGPDLGLNKFEWFSTKFKQPEWHEVTDDDSLFSRAYEWRLNMNTGEVKERNLTGTKFSMDFPTINGDFVGLKNKYAYTQVCDLLASSTSGMAKYGGVSKLYLDEKDDSFSPTKNEDFIKVEYHMFEEHMFCTGASFVAKEGSLEEDDGWIITFVHNEHTNTSQVHIIDTKKIESEAVAKINLPCRVPHGFHGAFMPIRMNELII